MNEPVAQALQDLLEALQEEYSLLEKNKAAELELFLERKQEILSKLDLAYTGNKELLVKSEKIKNLVSLCENQNLINGKIIFFNKRKTEQLLSIIFNNPQNIAYDSDAKTIRPSHQRSINRA